MNQRLKRKIEKRRRQKICEALDLCLQINGLQATGNIQGIILQCSMTLAGTLPGYLRESTQKDGKRNGIRTKS